MVAVFLSFDGVGDDVEMEISVSSAETFVCTNGYSFLK